MALGCDAALASRGRRVALRAGGLRLLGHRERGYNANKRIGASAGGEESLGCAGPRTAAARCRSSGGDSKEGFSR